MAAHVEEVLRAEPGQPLRVGLVDGPRGKGRVRAGDRGETWIECVLDEPPSERPRTDLVLCVPRPKSLRKLLPEVTAIGVDRIVLLRSWRVEPAYLGARTMEPDRLRALLVDGLVQSGETALPRVIVEPRFRPFVEDRLPALSAGARCVVLDPRAPLPLAAWAGTVDLDQRVVVAIGPEGGLIDFEVALLQSAGFARHGLGTGILRVETACVAGLAQIQLLRALKPAAKVSEAIDR